GTGDELVCKRRLAAVRAALLSDRADDRGPTDLPRPCDERHVSQEDPHERRLPGPVAAGDREAFAWRQIEVDRPDVKRTPLGDRALEAQDVVPQPRAGREREPKLPGLERLLRQLVALEESLRLADLRLERVRRAPVRAARLVAERIALPARLRAAGAQELRES